MRGGGGLPVHKDVIIRKLCVQFQKLLQKDDCGLVLSKGNARRRVKTATRLHRVFHPLLLRECARARVPEAN